MKRTIVLALVLAAVPAFAQSPATAEATYVVQPQDTCLGIAVRVLGDRDQLDALHKVNPQLGALPHDLVAGTVMNLPPRTTTPDAQLTRARGDVKIRKASSNAWDVAVPGALMFRAWRAWSGEQSTAELSFRDDSKLGMRERTIVVVYGPEKKLAKVITATAELAQGTLESRLGELDGKPVIVRTPSAETDLRAGEVVVSTAATGASIVANHHGTPVAVRGRGAKGTGVSVGVGRGSRVLPGKRPEPPRPLPAAPVWSTPVTAWVALHGAPSRAELAWTAVPTAATYRVAVRDQGGEVIAAQVVRAPALVIALPASADAYSVTVSATDADGFESAPSVPLAITLAEAGIAPVGSTTALTEVPARVTAGGAVVAPTGMACRAGGGVASDRVVLASAGPTTIACTTADGRAVAPFVVDVVGAAIDVAGTRGDLMLVRGERRTFAIEVASRGAIGESIEVEVTAGMPSSMKRLGPTRFEVTLTASDAAPEHGVITILASGATLASRNVTITAAVAPRVVAPGDRLYLGVLGGYHYLALGSAADLGNPDRTGDELAGGILGGIRGGWSRTWLGLEAEAAFANVTHVTTSGHATVLAARMFVQARRVSGPTTLGVALGGGIQAVTGSGLGTHRDTDPVGSLGLLAGYRRGRISYRLDVRYDVCAATSGLAQGIDASIGAAFEFGR